MKGRKERTEGAKVACVDDGIRVCLTGDVVEGGELATGVCDAEYATVDRVDELRPSVDGQDITALFVLLMNLSASYYPNRLEYVNEILSIV